MLKSTNFLGLLAHSVKVSNSSFINNAQKVLSPVYCGSIQLRLFNIAHIDSPKPNDGRYNYRYEVHYPKDGKYTIDLLKKTGRGGRDPVTGRTINATWGGGRRTLYRWIDFDRSGPATFNDFRHEKVIEIQYDPNRSAFIALVCGEEHMRYIIATTTMKPGDIIKSNSYVPEIPVRAIEGDSYPVGALAIGTKICQVSTKPDEPATFLIHAGCHGFISKKLPDNKIAISLPNKRQLALDERCMCVAGQVSNPDHNKEHIGSAQRLRWLGYRPRSGLWQRKDGYCGRKLRRPPPIKYFDEEKPEKRVMKMYCQTEEPRKEFIPKTQRRS